MNTKEATIFKYFLPAQNPHYQIAVRQININNSLNYESVHRPRAYSQVSIITALILKCQVM